MPDDDAELRVQHLVETKLAALLGASLDEARLALRHYARARGVTLREAVTALMAPLDLTPPEDTSPRDRLDGPERPP